MARNVYYTYDFEAHNNLSHKQIVLFYGTSRMFFEAFRTALNPRKQTGKT